MGSSAKRTAKQPARAGAPAAPRSRARAPIRASGKGANRVANRAPTPPCAPEVPVPTRASATPSRTPFALRAVLEELEPRLLMSADVVPLANDVLFATPTPAGGAEFRSLTDSGRTSAVTSSGVAPIQHTLELVFVDPRVPDRQELLAGLTAESVDGRRFEIIVLDPARDGVAQVTAALTERIQVDAVHFITHGTDAAVQLGGTWLDAKTLAANADAIAGWGNALKEDADLLFYGCDFAASARGRALVGWLAELTRADVAASTDATGAARAGGDWELEVKTGAIETAVAIPADAREEWSYALGAAAVGLETSANTTTGNTQDAAAMATAPDGRFVVAWVSDGQDGGGKGIFARVYDTSGAPQTAELQVNTTTANDQLEPAVAMDGAGNFVVAWSGSGTGDSAGVFARRFNAVGTPLGAEFRVNGAVTSGTQSSPDVAMETNGDFAVVWQSDETGSIEIWLQRYQADGTAIVGASLVSISGGNDDYDPAIAMDDDGDFVVAWESRDANNEGIFARRYDNGGNALGAPTVANATTSGHQQRPDVAMDADGDYVVVWDGDGASDGKGVYGRRFDAAGVPQGTDFRVNTEPSNDQDNAAVSMSNDGRFVVTWESKDQDGDKAGVYGQQYAAGGATDGTEFLVNTWTNDDQQKPAVAMADTGGYVVAWDGAGPGDSNGVFWQRFAVPPAGTISGTIYHDIEGDGNLAGAGVFANATVRLYRDLGGGTLDVLDFLQATTSTTGTGTYSFTGMPLGTYFVVVDSRSLGASNVWAEQTYGSAGSALGAGFTTSDGALFGGRSAAVSDNVTLLLSPEHVTRVSYTGTSIANIDSGFSFNAVTSSRDGDDELLSADRSIQGSLRQFIQNANVTIGMQAADFSIGGGGLQTIALASALQPITDRVTLDATTQEGYTGAPVIELNGASAGPAVSGLTLQAGSGGSIVRGFVINQFSANGIHVAAGSDGNSIFENWIGTDASGSNDLGNSTDGVLLDGDGNSVSGNVISGNQNDGIQIGTGSSGNQIFANYIGTNAAGTALLGPGNTGNSGFGVNVLGSGNTIGGTAGGAGNVISGNFLGVSISGTAATANLVEGNLIGTDRTGTVDLGNLQDGVRISTGAANNIVGGTVSGARNVISGNASDGIEISGTNTTGNLVQGNLIGTDAAGLGPLANTAAGVRISGGATNNSVGGTATGARNVISGNTTSGIEINGAGSTGNFVLGNTIGLNAAGNLPIANGLSGIMLISASGNTIGGTAPGARNVLSGNNQDGITGFSSNGNLIEGNYIGTDATGSFAIGNVEDGIYFENSSNNTVGGTSPADRNVLSGNGWTGVTFWGTGSGNVVQGNHIGTDAAGGAALGNAQAGVYLATSGPTTVGGTVAGAGNLIAYNGWDGVAIMTGAGHSVLGNSIHANLEQGIDINDDGVTPNDPGDGDVGTNNLQNFPVLTGAATNGTTVTIAGSLDSVASASYRVEFFANGASGQRYLGFATVPIGAAGTATFSATLTAAVGIGETVTATATGPDGSTSEFAATVTATSGFAISGTILHDVNGNANVTDDGAGAVFANADVRLHLDDGDGLIDSGDSFVAAMNTTASGTYSFGNLASGNYYVVVNSRTLDAGAGAYNGGFTQSNVWADQTYGVAGSANGAIFTLATGALYGGRNAGASDNAAGSINSAEHVTRVALAGGNVTGINSAFSFNGIVNARGNNADDDTSNARMQQGSLRQFILNANALIGAQTANFSIGGGGPQTINVSGAALPPITQAVILDAAATQEGFSGTPIIELNGAAVSGSDGLTITGGGSTVRGFAINRFQEGIVLSGGGGNTIAGNYLGTNLASAPGLGNQYGIRISSSANTIGGLTAADRNVVSGNSIDGIWVNFASDNLIRGNYIGTDATGTVALANNEDGIWLQGSSGNIVGGTAVGARNVISGNGWAGVAASTGGSGNVIQGNYIGVNAGGTALGNAENGIRIYDGVNHQVGGTAPGAGNVVAHNGTSGPGWAGVAIDSGSGHSVLGNSIYSNSGIGIDIGFDAGVTLNDLPDVDGLQNFPVLSAATTTGTQITITGTLNSSPGGAFRIEFFASPSPGDPSGYGEGERYLGFTTAVTDGSGNAIYTSPPFLASVLVGERISATATDLATGDTSEFGAHIAATVPNAAPVNNVPGPQNVNEDAPLTLNTISVNDPTGDLASVALTVLSGTLSVTPAPGVAGSGTASVTITGTEADINVALGSLIYQGSLDFSGTDTLTVTSTDGSGLQDVDTVTITVIPVNDAPAANDASASGNEDDAQIAITLTGTDVDGAVASFRLIGLPANGVLYTNPGLTIVAATGTDYVATANALTLYFVPAANWNGTTGFQFTAVDAGGVADATAATATLTVASVNDTPAAVADAAATTENTAVTTGDVLANDSVGDSPTTITTFDALSLQGGTVVLSAGNTFTYTPAATFSGTDTFTYTIRDVDGEISTATVTVTVANVANDPPINVVPGTQISAEDVALVFSTGNGNRIAVVDPDAGASQLQVTLAASQGTLTLAGTAGLTFTVGSGTGDATMTFTGTQAAINAALDGMSLLPPSNYTGAASVTITTDDMGASGAGGPLSDTDTVNVTVVIVDDAPTLDLDANNSSGAAGANYVQAFTEGFGSVRIADVDAALADVDSPNLASLTVTITNLLDGADEVLTTDTTGTSITATFLPGSGVLTLNGADTVAHYQQVLRTVRYENLSEAPSLAARVIAFVASDGGSASNVGTATVTIAAVNDAPTAVIAAPSYAATENVTLALHGTGMSVADIDALPSSIVTVQLASISGLLSATAGTTGVVVAGSGSPTLTFTGTLAQVNALLAGSGSATILYTVGSDSPAPTDTLDLSISDNGATGAGGAQWGWDSVTVDLTAVNDAPLITIPGLASTPEDTPLVFSAGGPNQISITDVDAAGSPVAVTLNVTNGVLTLAGTAGLSFTVGDGTVDANMTFTGTVAAINAALDGLAFAPTANYSGPAFLSLSVNDQGNSGLGGALTDADFATITVTGVNDAPAGADATVTTPQDIPYMFTATSFGFTDADAGDTLNAVRIEALPAAGSLTLSGTAVAVGQLIDLADITAGNLAFTPALGGVGAPYTSFAFRVQDSAGAFGAAQNTLTVNVATPVNSAPTGTDATVTTPPSTDYVFGVADFGFTDADAGDSLSAVRIDTLPSPLVGTLYLGILPLLLPGQVVAATDIAAGNLVFRPVLLLTGSTTFDFSVRDSNGPDFDPAPNTLTVSVVAPNNNPVNTVPGAQSVNEDSAAPIGGIAVSDPNGNLAFVQLGVANGAITVSLAGGATITAGLNGSPTLTLSGSQAQINAALATVGYQGNPDFAGADVLTITSTDLTALQDVDTVAITVNPVNDAPVAVAPPNYAAVEQSVLTLHGTGLAVADIDAGGANVTATLSAITGAIFVNPAGSTVAVSGSGTPLVTLSGTVAQINAVLAGSAGATVTYLVTSDSPPATDTLTLAINDGGATGAGGPRSASAVATIAIGASNDAPVNTLPGGSTTLEDIPVLFSAAGGNQISITDVDAGGAPVQVTIGAANGVMTLSGAGGLAFASGDGTADASMTFTGTVAAINAALNGLVFTPNPNYNGLAFITLTTNDLGASGSGGPLSDTDLATISVLPVNDAPDGTDTTVTLNEDSTYAFAPGDFGFTDVDIGDAMTEVRIDTIVLPAGATLQLAGANVTTGLVITVADITAGNLVFTPVADANGAGYAGFTFSVRDTGVPPGPLVDPSPNTMTITVAPVNDLPAITSDGGLATAALVVAENTVAVTTVAATDIDLQALTYSIVGGADAARFSIDSVTGVLSFNPAPNFEVPADAGANNDYGVVVRVSDGAGGTDTQALVITVTNGNDAPTAGAETYVTDEDTALAVTAALGLLGNDADEDLNPITAVLVGGPANGTVALNADGSFVYTPHANFYGTDSFTYRANDGALGSADATVTITVNPINDAPSAADSNVTVAPPAYAFTVGDFNYFDVDGDPLDRIMITALPVEGQLLFDGVAVTLNQEITAAEIAAGRLGYVPPTTGSATATSFGFGVSDGLVYASGSYAMTIGFASGLPVTPPPAPPGPGPVTPPPAPPGPPAGPPAGGGGTATPGGSGAPPAGGGRGGGGGPAGAPAGDAGAPPAPVESGTQAAAAVVATAVAPVASAPTGNVGFQSGGLSTDPRAAAPTLQSDSRGDAPAGEVKAAMEAVAAMAAPEVREELDKLREQAREEVKIEARVAGSVFVVSTGLSVGYVLWLLRGGALIASLLSSLPAWRLVDPLPVLGSMGGRAGDEDDDSLEDLVADKGPPSEPGEDAVPHTDNARSMQT